MLERGIEEIVEVRDNLFDGSFLELLSGEWRVEAISWEEGDELCFIHMAFVHKMLFCNDSLPLGEFLFYLLILSFFTHQLFIKD